MPTPSCRAVRRPVVDLRDPGKGYGMHPLDGDGPDATRPFPRVDRGSTTATLPPLPPPPPPARPPRTGPPAGDGDGGERGPYEHRFGSLPFYLFARAVAFAIDGIGVTFFLATAIRQAAVVQRVPIDAATSGGFGVLLATAFGLAFAIAFVCEALVGTTLGKTIFALHVRRRDGSQVGLGGVFVRTLLYPIDLPLVGLIVAALTPRRQRLGDLAAGTVVARSAIGGFASVIGIAVVIGLIYVQAAFLGGAAGVRRIAEGVAEYGPGYVSTLAGLVGGGARATAPQPTPTPTEPAAAPAEPSSQPSASELASPEPTAASTATPSPPPAEPTDVPSGAPPDAPITRPSPPMPTDEPVPVPTVTA